MSDEALTYDVSRSSYVYSRVRPWKILTTEKREDTRRAAEQVPGGLTHWFFLFSALIRDTLITHCKSNLILSIWVSRFFMKICLSESIHKAVINSQAINWFSNTFMFVF